MKFIDMIGLVKFDPLTFEVISPIDKIKTRKDPNRQKKLP